MARLAQLVRSVDVDVPRRAVYKEWTQVESFPRFLSDVHEVKQLDHDHVLWKVKSDRGTAQWITQILEHVPDRRIEWWVPEAGIASGMVTFDPLSDLRTRVTVRFDYEPASLGGGAGEVLGLISRRLEDGLQRFKEHLEGRGGGGSPTLPFAGGPLAPLLPGGPHPGGTLPGGTLPDGTLPGGTLPGGTLPGGTLPLGSLP